MFKLAAVKTVDWPVDVSVPQDGGKTKSHRFTAKFEILGNEEQESMLRGGDIVERVLVGWGNDVQDESGNVLEFSPEAKVQMLAISYVRTALLNAYLQVQAGQEAKRKN